MENYIVIKQLPDANVGTELIWNIHFKVFRYIKSEYHSESESFNTLLKHQVENNSEYFCKANEFPEYYAYNNPTFSRKEVLEIFEKCFDENNRCKKQIFSDELRNLGKINAEKILNKK